MSAHSFANICWKFTFCEISGIVTLNLRLFLAHRNCFFCSFQGAAADVPLSVSWWWTFARAGSAAVQADAAGLHSGKDSSAAATQDPAGGNVPPWQSIHEAAMAFITGALEQVEKLSVPCQFHASSFRANTRRISHSEETYSVRM